MKKLLSILFVAIAMLFVTSLSCTKDVPLCEQNHFGHVTVHNSTSIFLWVDATSAGDNYNHEARLAPGSSYKYTVDPGTVTVWAASDAGRQADSWDWDEIWINQCDEYSFTWSKKKGETIDSDIFLEIQTKPRNKGDKL